MCQVGTSKFEQVVTRKSSFAVFGVVVPLVFALMADPAVLAGDLVHDLVGVLLFPLILGAMVFTIWLVTWRSSIRATPDALSVYNALLVHEIPWKEIREIELEDGIKIVLKSGKRVGSVAYGGSLLGSITGYPSYKKAVQRLRAVREDYGQDPPKAAQASERTYFSFPWAAAAAWYLFFAIPGFIHLYF
ncbi:hypothetical protein Pmi06nite_73000 [Planotetraspora mira]|uniref:PH domain-containing protein n=2 Tax=Planotetraspora mira TaxID=58121 RepID=A0A8J3XEU6_9ACTN|nr:hypothetical protein Pmi06nite_73000 [Planotetraspora mira]